TVGTSGGTSGLIAAGLRRSLRHPNTSQLGRPTLCRRAPELDALEIPRGEATIVQMADWNLRHLAEPLERIPERLLVGRCAEAKFELEFHLPERDRIATHDTRRARAGAAQSAARHSRWQSAATDRFAGFLSEHWVGHRRRPQ